MIFLLPNAPELPPGVMHYQYVAPTDLIALNGNHWRKILTIIAKLVAEPDEDWRIVRDTKIWERATLLFTSDVLDIEDKRVVIVGKTFLASYPIPSEAKKIGERHCAFMAGQRLWTPYLDYRQFPNQLISEIRQQWFDEA